jgi:hypothetical protein
LPVRKKVRLTKGWGPTAKSWPDAEQRCDMQDSLAEAKNLIFAKYGKPEIAPRQGDQLWS